MIVWMLYSALVALIVAAAARAAESLGRVLGYRVRWIWLGAIVLTGYLSGSAAWRSVRPPNAPPVRSSSARDAVAVLRGRSDLGTSDRAAEPRGLVALKLRLDAIRVLLHAPLNVAVLRVSQGVSSAANTLAGALAAGLSLSTVIALTAIARRFGTARRAWPRMTLHGVEVRVAPHVGPLVVGIARPEIVIPEWLLTRDAAEQRMVVAHEVEHVRARDPLLIVVAWVAIALAPWNAALWYMLSRLRLAIELDCDARVLRQGAQRASYGALLIHMAEHASTLRPSALALVESSQLRQRILAMGRIVPRFALLRAGAAAAFALAASVIAATTTLPVHAQSTPPAQPDSGTLAQWRQMESTSAAVQDFPTNEVIRGWVKRHHPEVASADSRANTVVIAIDRQQRYVASLADAGNPPSPDSMAAVVFGHLLLETGKSRLRGPNPPLAIVDGKLVPNFESVQAETIESSEFIDAARAKKLYGPAAVNGAHVILTGPPRAETFLMEFGIKQNSERLKKLGVGPDEVGDIMMLNVRAGVVGPRRTVITVLQLKGR